MTKLLTGFAVASMIAGLSAAQACDWHKQDVSASVAPPRQVVAMSTADATLSTARAEAAAQKAATAPRCADGQKDCGLATK